MSGGGSTGSLARRLLGAQALVIAALSVTVVAVAAFLGPALFDRHMQLAGQADAEVIAHGEEAFISAGLVSLGAGLATAGAGALAANWLLTRRIGGSLDALEAGARRVAAGDYATPVTLPAGDRELETVARAFNLMARQIADTEARRTALLTDLSHELRTPVAAIDLLLEGLEDGIVAPDAATAATLRAQTARLARLAGDLRDVSRAEEGRVVLAIEPVEASELVASAVLTAAPDAEARGVHLAAADGLPSQVLQVDRARLGQVLDNLVRNALQHTPAGRSVVVWADASPGQVRIGVRDEGEGIAEADVPHVFERFYRAGSARRDRSGGTGVGLTISRALVAAHGGTLTASSAGLGRGSEFVVTLPAS